MKFSARKKKDEINLLPESGFSATTSGRVLSWLLSTFRVIVIVTEILVMVAFLSRFWLDAQNSDLNEQIEQKKNLLIASQGFEKNLADVQQRLKIYNEYSNLSISYSDNLEYLTRLLPPDVLLVRLVLDPQSLQIQGVSPNERSIQQFITNLQLGDRYTNVQIDTLQKAEDQEELMQFEVNAERIKT